MGRTCAKNGRRQTVKKIMENRRGWQRRRKYKSCYGKTVSYEILKGTNVREWKTIAEDRGIWRVSNESGRSYQVTWTLPHKGTRGGRRRVLEQRILSRPKGLTSCHRLKGFMEDDLSSKVLKFVGRHKGKKKLQDELNYTNWLNFTHIKTEV